MRRRACAPAAQRALALRAVLCAALCAAAAAEAPRTPAVVWGQDASTLFVSFALPSPLHGAPAVHINDTHVGVVATAGPGGGAAYAVTLALREDVAAEASSWATDRVGVKATLRKRQPHRFDRLLVRAERAGAARGGAAWRRAARWWRRARFGSGF
jgi:hypothetical protein